MRLVTLSARVVFLAVLVCLSSGCAFFSASGDGPMSRSELGNWVGIKAQPLPPADEVSSIVTNLEKCFMNPIGGKFSQVTRPSSSSWTWGDPREVPFCLGSDLAIKGSFNIWLRFVPSKRHGDWMYYAATNATRQFYAPETEWGLGLIVGDLILSGDQADAFDVTTRERVAARKTSVVLTLLGYTRVRRVLPLESDGEPGLMAITDPKVDFNNVQYEVKDGTALLAGLIGWGRVNHRRYFQILWIPIPLGRVTTAAAPVEVVAKGDK